MTSLSPLPGGYRPDFERIRIALLRKGEADFVPWAEHGVHTSHKERVLGRPLRGVPDQVEFARLIGYDFISVGAGIDISDELRSVMTIRDSDVEMPEGSRTVQRRWANQGEGAIRSEADLAAFAWPDPDHLDYSPLDEAEGLLPPEMKVIVNIGKVFNSVWWMMGLETFSFALKRQPALIEAMFERVCRIQERTIERVLDYKCVGEILHADDMAHSTGLMVSPTVYRRFVFPFYKRMNRLCRQRDVLTVFHSDGDNSAIVDDIIDAGFDAFNPVEPKAMDIVALKRRVAGRLSLIGNIDLGYTLTRGTTAEVDAEVRERIRAVAPGGGYCLASANSITDYVPFDNYLAMREAWIRYGRYPIRV